MTMPASGAVSLSQANTELRLSATAAITMNDTNVRNLGDKTSGAISFSDFYNRYYTFYGQQLFTTEGVNTWVCPENVTNIAAVCVGGGGGGAGSGDGGPGGGGGGLGYKNNITVAPGTTYYVLVGRAGRPTTLLGDGIGSHFIVSDAAPVSISSVSTATSVATVTTSASHGLSVDDTVTVESAWKPINGQFTVKAVISSTIFTYDIIVPASQILGRVGTYAAPQYTIVTTGTTDFTQFGAADSNPGTSFGATINASKVANPGTGTVKINTMNTATYGPYSPVGFVWKGATIVRGGGGDSGHGASGGDYSPSRTCLGGVYVGDGGGFGSSRASSDASTAGSGGGAAGYDGDGGSNTGGCGGSGSGSDLRGGGGGGVGLYGEGNTAANQSGAYNGGGFGGSRNLVVANFSGTTMTVTSVTSVGNLKVGSYLYNNSGGTNTVAGSGTITAGTKITALGTGTGGVGTYTINNSITATGVTVGSYADGIGGWRGGTHDSTGTTVVTGLNLNEYASISSVGTTNWTTTGAPGNTYGSGFIGTGPGTGTGATFNGGFGSSYGGSGGGHDSSSAGPGALGGVRLIYGQGRTFPSTLTTDQPEGFVFGTA